MSDSSEEAGNGFEYPGEARALGGRGTSEGEPSWEFDVVDDAERGRWIATIDAETIGELTYRFVGGRVVLLSTQVNRAYRNHRVATELVARALEGIRESGKTITIICPFVGEFIARNPEYLDLIDKAHPGSGAHPHQQEPAVGHEHGERLAAPEHDMT